MPLLTKSQKAKWVKALRSGEYLQGRKQMCNVLPVCSKQYCCLGVLREIEGTDSVCLNKSKLHAVQYVLDKNELFGDITRCGNFHDLDMPNLKGQLDLTQANDKGISFVEIAKHIEEYTPTLD